MLLFLLLSIFLLETAAVPRYLGCYADSVTRDLTIEALANGATIESCAQICAYYKYFGLQDGRQCFCGNSFGSQGTSTQCRTLCYANFSQICGGYWANSVYELDAPPLSFCHNTPSPPNITFLPPCNSTVVSISSVTCNFTCNEGFKLINSSVATCTPDGSWSLHGQCQGCPAGSYNTLNDCFRCHRQATSGIASKACQCNYGYFGNGAICLRESDWNLHAEPPTILIQLEFFPSTRENNDNISAIVQDIEVLFMMRNFVTTRQPIITSRVELTLVSYDPLSRSHLFDSIYYVYNQIINKNSELHRRHPNNISLLNFDAEIKRQFLLLPVWSKKISLQLKLIIAGSVFVVAICSLYLVIRHDQKKKQRSRYALLADDEVGNKILWSEEDYKVMNILDLYTFLPLEMIKIITEYCPVQWESTPISWKLPQGYSNPVALVPYSQPPLLCICTESQLNPLLSYDLQGKIQTQNNNHASLQALRRPSAIDVDSNGFLYIVDATHVSIGNINKQIINSWPLPETDGWIRGIKIDNYSHDTLYLTIENHHQIYIYTKEGKYKNSYGIKGKNEREFHHPRGVTVDTRFLYVCDCCNDRIQVLDKDNGGRFVRQWGGRGHENGQFEFPYCIYLPDEEGREGEIVYIGDNSRVQIFTRDGIFLSKLGETINGSEIKQFNYICGIYVFNTKLYVNDYGNDRIQIFSKQGAL